jgi:hypothetical protein
MVRPAFRDLVLQPRCWVPVCHGHIRPKSLTWFDSTATAFGCRTDRYGVDDTLLDDNKIQVRGDSATSSGFLLHGSNLSTNARPEIEEIANLLDGMHRLRSPNSMRGLYFDDKGRYVLTNFQGRPVNCLYRSGCACIQD